MHRYRAISDSTTDDGEINILFNMSWKINVPLELSLLSTKKKKKGRIRIDDEWQRIKLNVYAIVSLASEE